MYGYVQSQGVLPLEMLFEFNAALDHLSRVYVYGEPEQEVVNRCFSHFKRSCLDAFKIAARESAKQYNELRSLDTSTIDNGDFDVEMHNLRADIRDDAIEARRMEGEKSHEEDPGPVFERWKSVYVMCQRFEENFYRSRKVHWSKKRGILRHIRRLLDTLFVGALGGILFVWFNGSGDDLNADFVVADIVGLVLLAIWHLWDFGWFVPITGRLRRNRRILDHRIRPN